MIASLFTKIFGSRNDRLLRKYRPVVARINALESELSALSDEALSGKTAEFRQRLENGQTLDDLLPEAFAVVREASKRVHGMRHFDVQLVGGIMLHSGKIAEMRTGEGKTLTATLPVYLNALAGKGVHVVTVNDYLASRDAEMMGRLYGFLGLTTGVNLSRMPHEQKHEAYAADITYGTNNEFGFDYLRDNMVYALSERVQRGLNYAIVDEVDSILIDEARTPLIISGQADDHTDLYVRLNGVAPLLKRCEVEDGPGDYWVDEKAHSVLLTEAGHEHAEEILTSQGLLEAGRSLYEPANITLVHFLYASLRAHNLFFRDQQYVVQNGEIIIVDEFTGRLMPGRRWSDGLHQAVEAKEGVKIQNENQTLASITFQNYFRLYPKLGGMTGTALTEAPEFYDIYKMNVVTIPTNVPVQRIDDDDEFYKNIGDKFAAITKAIKDKSDTGQPIEHGGIQTLVTSGGQVLRIGAGDVGPLRGNGIGHGTQRRVLLRCAGTRRFTRSRARLTTESRHVVIDVDAGRSCRRARHCRSRLMKKWRIIASRPATGQRNSQRELKYRFADSIRQDTAACTRNRGCSRWGACGRSG